MWGLGGRIGGGRRTVVRAAALLMIAVAAPALAYAGLCDGTPAEATRPLGPIATSSVNNPGNVTVAINATLHTFSADIDSIHLAQPAAATITAGGALTIPQASMKFVDRDVREVLDALGDRQKISVKPKSAFTGTVNPTTGIVTLHGSLSIVFSASGDQDEGIVERPISCTIPTFDVSMSTNAGGSAYNQSTGKATVVHSGLAIEELPENAAGCDGWEDDVSDLFDLPASPDDDPEFQSTLTATLTFRPILRGPTTTTTKSTTTTTQPSTTTASTTSTSTSTSTTTTSTSSSTTTTTMRATTTTTLPIPSATTTTWKQHCTGGDPDRCHDVHHPHVPHTPSH